MQADDSKKIREEALRQVREALKNANEEKKPPIDDLFNDVYDTVMPHLEEQRKDLKHHLRLYRDKYDLASFRDGPKFPDN